MNFEYESGGQRPLDPEQHYDYRVEQGPVSVSRSSGPLVFPGSMLLSIQDQAFDDPDVLRAAGRLLRAVITHHLGGKELKSRQVLRELHRGRIAASRQSESASG